MKQYSLDYIPKIFLFITPRFIQPFSKNYRSIGYHKYTDIGFMTIKPASFIKHNTKNAINLPETRNHKFGVTYFINPVASTQKTWEAGHIFLTLQWPSILGTCSANLIWSFTCLVFHFKVSLTCLDKTETNSSTSSNCGQTGSICLQKPPLQVDLVVSTSDWNSEVLDSISKWIRNLVTNVRANQAYHPYQPDKSVQISEGS